MSRAKKIAEAAACLEVGDVVLYHHKIEARVCGSCHQVVTPAELQSEEAMVVEVHDAKTITLRIPVDPKEIDPKSRKKRVHERYYRVPRMRTKVRVQRADGRPGDGTWSFLR